MRWYTVLLHTAEIDQFLTCWKLGAFLMPHPNFHLALQVGSGSSIIPRLSLSPVYDCL